MCGSGSSHSRRARCNSTVPGISYWQALLAEIVGTFLLMITIMGIAVDEEGPPKGFAGIIIGLTVAGIITTLGNISGSSLNPARTFGPYLNDMIFAGTNLWKYFPHLRHRTHSWSGPGSHDLRVPDIRTLNILFFTASVPIPSRKRERMNVMAIPLL